MGRSNYDMSDWLIRLKKDKAVLLSSKKKTQIKYDHTVFPRFSAPGRLPIFEVFGGALNRAGALIKTYENLDLPFPAHTRNFIYNI